MPKPTPPSCKKKIIFEKKVDLPSVTQFITPSQEIQVGTAYTIEQLIEASIKYSDNQALLLLSDNLPESQFIDLYRILGTKDLMPENPETTLSVKQYSTFFRILFNSSFLNHDSSEKALKLLSEVEYKNGLNAGVPKDITISHKFGESGKEYLERQLHDCGIIYYPNHPYLLCIMSKGKNLSALENSVRDVSRFVYQKISSEY